jgi:hypothetical protein
MKLSEGKIHVHMKISQESVSLQNLKQKQVISIDPFPDTSAGIIGQLLVNSTSSQYTMFS